MIGLGALDSGAAGASAPAPAASCASKGVTLRANAFVRLFEAGSREQTYGIWLCRRGARRARWLFDTEESAARNPAQAALAGWWVAYRSGYCPPGEADDDPRPPASCRAGVRVLDARSGRSRVERLDVGSSGRTGIVASLATDGRRIYWQEGAVAHSHRLG